jgi:hypothetical protein
LLAAAVVDYMNGAVAESQARYFLVSLMVSRQVQAIQFKWVVVAQVERKESNTQGEELSLYSGCGGLVAAAGERVADTATVFRPMVCLGARVVEPLKKAQFQATPTLAEDRLIKRIILGRKSLEIEVETTSPTLPRQVPVVVVLAVQVWM